MRAQHGRCFPGIALAVFAAAASMSSAQPAAAPSWQTSSPLQDPGTQTAAASVLDGVFTSDQAKRGGDTFRKVCAACHTLAEHSGRKFTAKWDGTSVGELFDLISNTMPDGNPGSLTPEEYSNVIAFMLKETGYPEGKEELPADSAALMKVRIEPPAAK
jgi:S-disulfanyl-L-cysteine oxidoreductase SoxD